ncbi:MAG TPA: pirin family protein [Acidimicrobiales bacterium]|nr:pirin family protein [Acidimicrobiales bacterium]
MPAVTVSDILTLDAIASPPPDAPARPVRRVSTAPTGHEGEGFPVRRAFAGVPHELLDPFIHMDQMGEVEYGVGEARGTSWHPHRGFETVTYMIDGAFEHQDSIGNGGLITNGSTQWMTAGGGILHIEKPPEHLVRAGGLFHGVQLWVNLPAKDKLMPAAYQGIEADDVRLARSVDGGVLLRIVAGDVAGVRGPGSTHTPINYVHATIAPGAELKLAWREDFNALVYVLNGDGYVGGELQPVHTGQLAVFEPKHPGPVVVTAAHHQESRHDALDVLILGGQPIGQPIAWQGPFVMNTKAEVLQAFEDFRAGRMGHLPD